MNVFRSCPAIQRPDMCDHPWDLIEGEYCFKQVNDHGILYIQLYCVLPEEGSRLHGLPLNVGLSDQASWDWDGNTDAPTLHPSIASGPENARIWHGYLTAGVFAACE